MKPNVEYLTIAYLGKRIISKNIVKLVNIVDILNEEHCSNINDLIKKWNDKGSIGSKHTIKFKYILL